VLAASVLAALATSGGTVLTMPDSPADAAEPGAVPAPQPAAPVSAALPAPAEAAAEPATVPQALGPPVSGAQIAGLAVEPARQRADAIAADQAAAEAAARAAEEERARREAEEDDEDDDEDARPGQQRQNSWDEFRRELREACQEGRIRGQVCRGA
jgi:hypothetical protein